MELDQELYDYLLAVSLMEIELEGAESGASPFPPPTWEPPAKALPEPRQSAPAGDFCAERKAKAGPTQLRAQAKENADARLSPVDPSWEIIDPTPNIHALFVEFDREYFYGSLDTVTVSWSPRMTLCAGICSYRQRFCQIRLSVPLLKLRPRKDLVETLLHEMIHAYLFLYSKERESHGPLFHKHMRRINEQIGSNITVYHTFDQEVSFYKRHWWRCNGRCQYERPFFGYVKRAMNRAPGPNDYWWASHQASCGGTFIKIRDPKDENNQKAMEVAKKHGADIRSFMQPKEAGAPPSKVARVEKKEKEKEKKKEKEEEEEHAVGKSKSISADPSARFPGKGQTLGGSSGRSRLLELFASSQPRPTAPKPPPNSRAVQSPPLTSPPRQSDIRSFFPGAPHTTPERSPTSSNGASQMVTCPCCAARVPADRINEHLDSCLS